MKKLKTITKNPSAWVVSSKDRGRKSIKNGKVYLYDKEMFEIELFNPLKVSVLAKIKLNGSFISSSGLVISPGERIYLDCFIDDKRKFIFKTYKIDNTQESLNAIKDNGLLEVNFYKESIIDWSVFYTRYNFDNWKPYPTRIYSGYNSSPTLVGNSFTTNGATLCSTTTSSTTSNVLYNNAESIETGRVQKGEESKQKFENDYTDFEHSIYSSTVIQILPNSVKPIYSSELNKKKLDKNDFAFVDLLTKLNDLFKSGVLTESEYNSKKKEILSRI
jgi:hypothetical protein